ncbi:TetR/AcrR family transcriptional regulator [Amycolatopsis acidicola]|uniref:TetR/AcrR family transcriptional regulator n=1 Tax=Amycolatopsis acidicola TaxID=2596893 RepID=A0A5N0VJS2_9PSEU|nr:TetR/AcrR family transcriptional regulator [Amycolatopsis acidicola]KAA9165604.1 TetR/AcrR family transcriptional regulator [Amycolatopsis acidicola]
MATKDRILDVAEQLMSEKGYAGTSVAAVCKAAEVSVTSLYWHFGSKEGLLASVMERGADRWFAALPRGDADTMLAEGSKAVAGDPLFLRLCYLLSLEAQDDERASALVQRVRGQAHEYFREVITTVLAAEHPPEFAKAAAGRLTPFAVAYSDGCFFASQVEPAKTDLEQMYSDLFVALRALAKEQAHA